MAHISYFASTHEVAVSQILETPPKPSCIQSNVPDNLVRIDRGTRDVDFASPGSSFYLPSRNDNTLEFRELYLHE